MNKHRCKGKTKEGAPCRAKAGSSGYCTFHDPALGAARAQGRRRGGQANITPHGAEGAALPAQVRTLTDVLSVLDYALAEARPMLNTPERGRLLVSIARAFVEAIKVGELEQRLLALEAAASGKEPLKVVVEYQNPPAALGIRPVDYRTDLDQLAPHGNGANGNEP